MMTGTKADSTDICESCGCVIPNAVFKERSFFGVATCRQTKCVRCAFLDGFRERAYKSRPYRIPAPRPTKEGDPPEAYVKSFEEQKERRIKSAEE